MGSVAICKYGQVVYEYQVGVVDKELKKKADKNSIYRIGSVSKIFTSTIIFQLIQEEKISLDTKLSTYFPKVKRADKITIAQMLNHCSGLANYTAAPDFMDVVGKSQSKEAMLARIIKSTPDFNPGKKHEYSNSNYLLLGYIIEEIEKNSYAEILKQRILTTADLRNTYYGDSKNKKDEEAISFAYQEGKWQTVDNWDLSTAGAAGAILSTPKDLGYFIFLLFQNRLITPESLNEMTDIGDGYGKGIFTAPYNDKKSFMHGGSIEGFKSSLFYFPTDSVSFVILSNGLNFNANDIALAMMGTQFEGDFEMPDLADKAELQLGEDVLKKYVGNYVKAEFPMQIKIFIKEKTLHAQATGQEAFPLSATTEDSFQFTKAGIEMHFTESSDAQTIMVLLQGGNKIEFIKE